MAPQGASTKRGCWALAAALTFSGIAHADVRLSSLISDNMMFQRDVPARVWGWADRGEKVTVRLDKLERTAAANERGEWLVEFPPLAAGGPYEMTVRGRNTILVKNILIGEVWVCSGQSNMEWAVVVSRDRDKEIEAAEYPSIRLFTVSKKQTDTPERDCQGRWQPCSKQSIAYFSSVAYFFGRKLHQDLKVPVGLVVAAVGGTRIEPWTPACGVDAVAELKADKKGTNGDLFNGMIHPLTPLRIRGVIWYQGEGNVGDGMIYFHRMRALVAGWRHVWGQGDFPFYYVQIAPLNWGGKSGYEQPALWEAQTAALRIPNTGMVVTNDIGNIGDAHPRNKQEVGRRLALWALAKTYGQREVVCASPIYKAMRVEGNRIRISFAGASGGLGSRNDKPLTWFQIAGADRKFVSAQARIDGETVVVWSEQIDKPVAVRFAWHQIAEHNLMNQAGLPASPFRTDDWPIDISKGTPPR
jgi:sialate O-acetylesterase